jgi:hypothetical protein
MMGDLKEDAGSRHAIQLHQISNICERAIGLGRLGALLTSSPQHVIELKLDFDDRSGPVYHLSIDR